MLTKSTNKEKDAVILVSSPNSCEKAHQHDCECAKANRVVIQSGEGTSVVVDPEFGGQVVSLQHDGVEYLAIGEPRRPQQIDENDFLTGGLGGLDDCLPAISPGVHPTTGQEIRDHGDIWYRPSKIVERSPNRLTLSSAGLSVPFDLVRTFSVGQRCLSVEYSLTNPTSAELPYVWAAHPLFRVWPTSVVEICGQGLWHIHVAEPRLDGASIDHNGNVRSQHPTFNMLSWSDLPEGTYLKAFTPWGGDAVLRHDSHAHDVRVRLTSSRSAFLGLWLNKRGIPSGKPHTHLAIEPTFGSSDEIAVSFADRSALVVEAYSTEAWRVDYIFEAAVGSV